MNDPIFLFGFSTSWLELISFILSVITVWFNIRQVHWAWLFAINSSALYALVFFDAKLYGDMGLQFFFIAVSSWGWVQWIQGNAEPEGLPITTLNRQGLIQSSLGWLLGFVLLSAFLKAFTDTDVPYADGFLTAGSLLGQILLSRKKIENWHVWIIVDILYVGLYLYKQLFLTAVLYALFVVMAIVGLQAWNKLCLKR